MRIVEQTVDLPVPPVMEEILTRCAVGPSCATGRERDP